MNYISCIRSFYCSVPVVRNCCAYAICFVYVHLFIQGLSRKPAISNLSLCFIALSCLFWKLIDSLFSEIDILFANVFFYYCSFFFNAQSIYHCHHNRQNLSVSPKNHQRIHFSPRMLRVIRRKTASLAKKKLRYVLCLL